MKKRVLITIAVCLVAFLAFAVAFEEVSKPAAQVPVQAVQVKPVVKIYTVDELLAEANRLRAEKGVAPLIIDERLNQSAQWKADDMKEFKYFGHVKPGESGTNGTQKAIDLTGMDCVNTSENLHENSIGRSPFNTGFGTGWKNSEKHYAALVNIRYETTGFGYALVNGNYTYVQHFCDLR